MTIDDAITPPRELVQEWGYDANLSGVFYDDELGHWAYEQHITTRAAQWGADQELEACCEWLEDVDCDDPQDTANELRAARRPQPASLKQQALKAALIELNPKGRNGALIIRALEQLDD